MTRKSVIWMSAALLAAGVGFLSVDEASAGWGRGTGYRNSAYGYQSYGNSRYGGQNYGYQPGRGYAQPGFSNRGGHFDYHDTTHFDYHPPTITRHGNHFDRTPGHFDLHRSGHYDHH